MQNARMEFLAHIADRQVKCAIVIYKPDYYTEHEKYLRCDYDADQLANFLKRIDFDYDDGYGHQMVEGTIWYTDGTYSSRGEYDGSEWREHSGPPEIPNILNPEVILKQDYEVASNLLEDHGFPAIAAELRARSK